MGTNDAEPGAALEPCPGCGRDDQVRSVPAVYLGGHDRVTLPAAQDADGTNRTVTRETTSALARALAPVPENPLPTAGRTALGVLAALVSLGTFIGGAAGGHWFSGNDDDLPELVSYATYARQPRGADVDLAFLGWISLAALLVAVALFAWSAYRRALYRRLLAGRPAAEAVWSRGRYCARCATVHLGRRAGGDGRALSLGEFRVLVWQAGGYGHLADGQPVY
ncbi:hypothetical protein [Kitasatospora camelliae]|uniref:Uncharacterized protein n=1 Tax=Kitasatospora camelliae TaxID=3156397 RepID=A0AAU8K7Q0_9ACTN